MASIDRTPSFTLRQLAAFVAVAETGTISAAAERLLVSQSAVSLSVSELEKALRAQLCVRRRAHGVQLTPTGEAMLVRARMMLQQAGEMEAESSNEAGELAGPLSLGCYPTVGPTVLPPLLARFTERHPEVTVRFREAMADELAARLDGGELDTAILYDLEIPERWQCATLLTRRPAVVPLSWVLEFSLRSCRTFVLFRAPVPRDAGHASPPVSEIEDLSMSTTSSTAPRTPRPRPARTASGTASRAISPGCATTFPGPWSGTASPDALLLCRVTSPEDLGRVSKSTALLRDAQARTSRGCRRSTAKPGPPPSSVPTMHAPGRRSLRAPTSRHALGDLERHILSGTAPHAADMPESPGVPDPTSPGVPDPTGPEQVREHAWLTLSRAIDRADDPMAFLTRLALLLGARTDPATFTEATATAAGPPSTC